MIAIQNQREIETIKKYAHSNKDCPLISKQIKIFHKLVDERVEEITS